MIGSGDGVGNFTQLAPFLLGDRQGREITGHPGIERTTMSIPTSGEALLSQQGAGVGAPRGVEAAISQASRETGVDFAYLMEKAAVESGFQPGLKASTSSATGLYQFIDSTWLSAMKAHGAEHGLAQYADAIQRRGDGGYSVADPQLRRQILDLRKDPKISAELAAELTKDNKAYLESKLGSQVGSTELYLAHFLGAAGATRFLSAMRQNPSQAARDVCPEAASSNTPIFYNRQSGQPTTLAQVYDRFARKFQEATVDVANATNSTAPIPNAALSQVITSVASGSNPLSALNSSPLSNSTVLALAALETPDEAREKEEQQTAYGSHRVGATGTTAEAAGSINEGHGRMSHKGF